MFEESLVESAHLLRAQSRWPAIVSITLQAAMAITLVALPMLHPELLSLRTPSIALLTPPRPAPPPPPVHAHLSPTTSASTAISAPSTSTNTLPRIDRQQIAAEVPAAPNLTPTGIMPGNPATLFSGSAGPPTTGIHVVASAAPHTKLNLSTGVSAGLLLSPLHPVYPRFAIMARQEGTVVVQAVISRAGTIESAHVISGPAMLQEAALEAVRSARYRPYLLNNEPTEVDTTFNINFRMGSSNP